MMDEGLMGSLDAARRFIELCAGYKAACVSAGFAAETAEQMAADYHRYLYITLSRAALPEALR